MEGVLPEPILSSELVHLDHITIAGQTVEFRHVFYTWMAMRILFAVGWLVRRNISLVPGRMQNIFESIIGGLEDFTVTNMGEDGRKVFPVLGGLFLFIAVQNILGLIPACDAPTANINTNIAIGSFNFDLAPVIIVAFFTALLVMGTKIGARVDGALTILKIAIVVFIVVVGFFYIKAENFTPFIPPSEPAASTDGSGVSAVMEQPLWQWATGMAPSIYGVTGIISGAALVFFAFLGFGVVATASEETINPKKSVPLGIGVGLGLIIVLYTLVAIVTTGMVSYKDLAKQSDPSLAVAFKMVGADWAAKIISLGIVIGMATVVMVLLLGLTRVVFAMSRDGLLPRGLSHTGKHGTPVRLQIIVGVVMALIAACCNVGILSDMVNIGTLSAFTLVAISIPIMRKKRPDLERSFKIPGNPWVPILIAIANLWLMVNLSVLTWIRFVVWLIVGFAIYFGYGYRHARLGAGELEVAAQE